VGTISRASRGSSRSLGLRRRLAIWHTVGSLCGMILLLMESGALIVTFLMGWEMHRQRVPWRALIIRCAIALALMTSMIALWRGRMT
jgi:hypothetical protein